MLYFNTEAINKLGEYIDHCKAMHKSIVVLCDNHTLNDCLPVLEKYIPFLFIDKMLSIPFGEEHKTLDTIANLWEQLLVGNIHRNAVLISLGGGVVCDLGGFVSATFKRGIDSVLIPTSLMAQVDAAIGGKTGFNFRQAKNQIGLFSYPDNIFIIPEFLKTLPEREILSGFAEMLKHGLIADASYWNELIEINSSLQMIQSQRIKRSVEIKTNICNIDYYEQVERKKLNFGHTIGHALESYFMTETNPLSHGEAVAFGMIAETYISFLKGLISENELTIIVNALQHFFSIPTMNKINFLSLSYYLQKDKKKTNDSMNFTLLRSIGNALINQSVTEQEIMLSLDYLNKIFLNRQ